MFTQYTHELLSIILCSTLVNFYLLVIWYGELLFKKADINGYTNCKQKPTVFFGDLDFPVILEVNSKH
jgi:hypothetical protein